MKRKGINKKNNSIQKNVLYASISTLINQSKQRVLATVNQELTLLYWNIGKLIEQDILKNKRAKYGEKSSPNYP